MTRFDAKLEQRLTELGSELLTAIAGLLTIRTRLGCRAGGRSAEVAEEARALGRLITEMHGE